MAAKWTDDELTVLTQNLVDGFPVQRMKELISSRERGGAIQLKAQDFDYGVTTSKVDGIKRFYADIKSRILRTRAVSEMDDVNHIVNTIEAAQLTQAVPSNAVQHVEPETRIIQHDGLSANTLAVRMLTENNLSVDPDMVCMLSKHILKEHL